MTLLEQFVAKAQVTGDLGEKLDKDLESAQAEANVLFGGAKYIKEAINTLASLSEHIRKDFEEGKFENRDGKQVHDLLLDYQRKTVECLDNFAEKKKAEALVANGKVYGIRSALEEVKKHHVASTSRASQIMAAVEEAAAGTSQTPNEEEVREARRARRPGEHPGPSALDARRAAALKTSLEAPKEPPKERGRRPKKKG